MEAGKGWTRKKGLGPDLKAEDASDKGMEMIDDLEEEAECNKRHQGRDNVRLDNCLLVF